MPDLQKIRIDFQSLYGKSKQNPEMPEEELRTLFNKSTILENLGYSAIGKDIRLELFIKGKKSDIACIDDYGNVVFVVEFKKPSDRVELKEHFDQLWDRYVKPLRADFGALINGYELILYKRIGENNNLELRVNLSEITDKDCELIYKLLKKPDYSLTQVKDILNYLNKFSAPESRIYLTTDAAREHFFENFKLEVDSIFGELLRNTIKLFDYEYSRSKFLTSAYDFWRKSYAKKPDKVPESWKKLLKGAGLTTGEEDLYKFMFCLETTYALFTRFILAKACADYQFPGIDFSSFISKELENQRQKGRSMGIFMASWGILAVDLINKMRRELVESVFEEDIFYWWTDDFEDLGREDPRFKELKVWHDERSREDALFDFSKSISKVLYALYKFDFSKIIGDPLGDLYQKYFDRETRKALGEFYTPREVVEYIVDAVDYRGRGIVDKRLLDPACGSGTFLVEALKRYLNEAEPVAKERGWGFVLSKLCNEYHIVGFDIHPFATIMAQIQFMLVLIPYYKKAIELNENFVLKRLPIFRTDSLIDESKSELMTLSMFEGGRSVEISITLPVRVGNKFVDAKIIMPHKNEAISEKSGLLNIPEYFAALQALFDTVKEAARAEPEKQVIEKDRLESSLKLYLPNKDWGKLAGFFMPYGRYFLDTIKKLRSEYGDGRLVKSIEDIILAGLLKNYVEYDFVVGNPPYIQIKGIQEEQRKYFKENFITAYGRTDLYVLFIERGINWLNRSGRLGYITSNKFILSQYGKELRNFIFEKCAIQQIIDFGDSGVFKDATNYPCILIIKENEIEKIQTPVIVVKVNEPNENILTNISNLIKSGSFEHSNDYFQVFRIEQSALGKDVWGIDSKNIQKLQDKIQNNAIKLEDLCKVVREASASGSDKVFIVDKKQILENNFEKELIFKFVKGEDVRRWNINWEELFVIYPYLKIGDQVNLADITRFPKIESYLLKHKTDLEKRYCVNKGGKKWYEWHDPAYSTVFETEKIVCPDISDRNNFTFDKERKCFKNTCYVIVIDDDYKSYINYICTLLNSNIMEFYFKHISPFVSGGYYRYKTQYLEKLPIHLPKTPEEESFAQKITARVEQILSKVKSDQRAARFPEEYIKEYRSRGEEFDAREVVFNANHKELALEVERSLDNEFLIKIKGTSPIVVDSESKAEYVKAALAGMKVSKGEKIQILIPRTDTLSKEAVAAHHKDLQEAQGIAALEGEINELVYKLYGLDENDKKVIKEFLSKF